jgi:hypothetical protein
MKFDTLLNTKEYLHISFLILVFIGLAIGIDFESEVHRARSIIVILGIGLLYNLKSNDHFFSLPLTGIEKIGTNYGIVGPLGMVLIALWLALIDFKDPDIPSKYIGILMIFTIVNALGINNELNERSEERIITDESLMIHKVVLWVFFGVIYFIAARYFLINGSWEWGFDPFNLLLVAF